MKAKRTSTTEHGGASAGNADRRIERILEASSTVLQEHDIESELASTLVETCYKRAKALDVRPGLLLAAAYDLLVTAEYYSALTHSGWLYCPSRSPRLFFHYTNCCPRHVLSNVFHFHPSNKPESGRIGTATARLLLLFLDKVLKHHGRTERVLRGVEPVDAVVVDDTHKRILLAEIKASPLTTPSVSLRSQRLTGEEDGSAVAREHGPADNTSFYNAPLEVLIPKKTAGGGWIDSYFPLGSRAGASDNLWGYRGILALLRSNNSFFDRYAAFWCAALAAYHPKDTKAVFWLTNACGTPTPVPRDWPTRRRGSGYESVSDSKTSVGMDRTDDIKKGIYQVLKLGSEGKPTAAVWNVKTGLISNIHAARHFDQYLASISDVVWTIDVTGNAKRVSDLPGDHPLYNLFDGIVALTSTLSRDDWVNELFRL